MLSLTYPGSQRAVCATTSSVAFQRQQTKQAEALIVRVQLLPVAWGLTPRLGRQILPKVRAAYQRVAIIAPAPLVPRAAAGIPRAAPWVLEQGKQAPRKRKPASSR